MMRRSPRLQVLLGAVTTVVFFGVGGSLFMGGQTIGGSVLMGLGAFRAVYWLRDVRWAFLPDDEDTD